MKEKIQYIPNSDVSSLKKGWGQEIILCNEKVVGSEGYCGKILDYRRRGSKSSDHYHLLKRETFFVLNGFFHLKYYDIDTGENIGQSLSNGDVVIIPPGNPHQLTCISEGGRIMEFSTYSVLDDSDNYRIGKGDSQKA